MKWIKAKFNKYPAATLSVILAVGAFSRALDFTKFNLIALFMDIGIGLVEFISFYIFVKILEWLGVL